VVRSLLLSVKFAIQKDNWTFSTIREKNMDTLTDLGIGFHEVKNEVLSLSVTNYCSGPLKDPKMGGEVWVFGKIIEGKEIYIKLKLMGDQRDQRVAVLSFHPPDRPLSYYFKMNK
jgi:hypothetical protein